MPFSKLRLGLLLSLLLLCVLASSCERRLVVHGRVLDVKGEELPGVAVRVAGTASEALSNPLGEYALRCPPRTLEISYIKSGYTPGRLVLDPEQPQSGNKKLLREVTVSEVQLWPLPPRPGVYLYRDYRYTETTRIEPKRYRAKSGGEIFGTKKLPDLLMEDRQPRLIACNLPSYDAQIYRLEEVEAQQPEASGDVFPEKVWAGVESIPVFTKPIDEPEQLLLELELGRPLELGTYAVHWGALDGHISTNETARLIFLFRVIDPEQEAQIRAEAAAGAEKEAERRRGIAESAKEEED